MQKRLLLLLTLTTLITGPLLLAACGNLRFPGVYRIDIEQGNIVDEEMLGNIKSGMTQAQVRFVMGAPQLIDPFDPNHWVYPYRLRRGDGTVVQSRIDLWFDENGVLARQEGSAVPAAARAHINTSGTGAASTTSGSPAIASPP